MYRNKPYRKEEDWYDGVILKCEIGKKVNQNEPSSKTHHYYE